MQNIKRIFSRDEVNPERQTEADLLRGFTAIVLIICHVGLYLGSTENTALWTVSDIIGSEFCAPVFMALMGIGMVYSRHGSPKELALRGVRLFLTGYALSLFRSILPLVLFGNIDEWTSVPAFFVVDILQFAGLSFLFIALLKKCKLPNIAILALSFIMVFADQLLMLPDSVPFEGELLTGIVNLFCPVTEWSCFPFLTWFFFPAFGLMLGELLRHCADKKAFYGILLPLGLAGVVYVHSLFRILYPDYTCYYFGNNFYYMGLRNVLLNALFICFGLSFWFFADKILPGPVKRFLGFLSKNLNPFYIFSWIFISALIHLQAMFGWVFRTWATVGLIVLLTVVCAVATELWLRLKAKIKAKINK